MEERLNTALGGLTDRELSWSPALGSNSIGFVLWHVFRAEDYWFQQHIQHQAELYESQGWQERLGTPPRDTGYQYTAEQLANFQVPPRETLLAYGKAVRTHTLAFPEHLPGEKLDDKLRADLQRVITELTLHIGQVAYLRGMQRGLNK